MCMRQKEKSTKGYKLGNPAHGVPSADLERSGIVVSQRTKPVYTVAWDWRRGREWEQQEWDDLAPRLFQFRVLCEGS